MKLGVIGYGKMGSAIVRGAISAGVVAKEDVAVFEINEQTVANLREEGFAVCGSVEDVLRQSDAVLFAIKPQEAKAVIAAVKDTGKCRLVLSIMAGISLSAFQGLGQLAAARIMPNTCAVIGESASAICYNEYITDETAAFTRRLFGAIGTYVEIEEALMDEIIPAGGSFTAYAYLFMKAFVDSSVKRGIDAGTAKTLVIQSMIGSAKMAEKFEDLDKLITDVCSKGGTTLAGLEKLRAGGFEQLIDDCCVACAERAKELGAAFG